jgi:predicted SnoaL-like aldol condensation-catalyzing enzyme
MTEAVLGGDFDAALTFIASDAVDHSSSPGAPPGHDGWRLKWGQMAALAGQMRFELADRISSGNTVASRYTILSADGQQLGFALDMLRVQDGKIVEHWALPATK